MAQSPVSFPRLAQGGLQAFGLALVLNVLIFYLGAGLRLYDLNPSDFSALAGAPVWLGAVVLLTAFAIILATLGAWIMAFSARRPATRFGQLVVWFGLLSLAAPAVLATRWPKGICVMLGLLHLTTTIAIRTLMPTAMRRAKRFLHKGFEDDDAA